MKSMGNNAVNTLKTSHAHAQYEDKDITLVRTQELGLTLDRLKDLEQTRECIKEDLEELKSWLESDVDNPDTISLDLVNSMLAFVEHKE